MDEGQILYVHKDHNSHHVTHYNIAISERFKCHFYFRVPTPVNSAYCFFWWTRTAYQQYRNFQLENLFAAH